MKIFKIILLSLLAFYLLYKITIFVKIDSCLDKGGAWDYPNKLCVTDNNISLNEIKCLSEHGNYNLNTAICEY